MEVGSVAEMPRMQFCCAKRHRRLTQCSSPSSSSKQFLKDGFTCVPSRLCIWQTLEVKVENVIQRRRNVSTASLQLDRAIPLSSKVPSSLALSVGRIGLSPCIPQKFGQLIVRSTFVRTKTHKVRGTKKGTKGWSNRRLR